MGEKAGWLSGDIMGYNYADPQAEAWHKKNPKIAIVGTENVSAVGTRGAYGSRTAPRERSAPTTHTPRQAAHRRRAGGAS